MAEFGPVLYSVFFWLVLMPVLDVGSLLIAGATQYLATNDIAAKAATQANFSTSLNSMATEAYQFQSTGLAQFVHMVPGGGCTGCGDDMYVLSTNIGSGSVNSSAANQPLSQTVDTQTNMYELQVQSTYNIAYGQFGIGSVVSDVPGLGKPVTLSFTANRPVERPAGLGTQNNGGVGAGGGGVSQFPRVVSPTVNPVTNNVVWRNPNIFAEIQAAGQTVVSVNVFTVQGNNTNWTPSGVSLAAGQHLWIDTQAVGVWNSDPEGGYASVDANGSVGFLYSTNIAPNIDSSALIGQVGTSGTPFEVGNSQNNYSPSGTGPIQMIMNDTMYQFNDNTGAQMVRLIVVQ